MRKFTVLLFAGLSAAAFASAWFVQSADDAGLLPAWKTPGDGAPVSGALEVPRPQASSNTGASADAKRRAASDFNGDGRSDLILAHLRNDWFAYWTMAGADPVAYSPVHAMQPGQFPVAVDDFDGDGRADLLTSGTTTDDPWARSVRLLRVGANGVASDTQVGTVQAPEEVRAVGDIGGDGHPDVVLHGESSGTLTYWMLDASGQVHESVFLPAPARHRIVASGDFNGDNRLDLLWQSRETRALLMWIRSGTGSAHDAVPVRDLALGWEVWGADDVDGDGRTDLLLTNPSFRYFAYWTMNGATPARFSPAFALPGQGATDRYGPVTAGDYNGDGKLDIVLSRERSQDLMLWQGDGNGFAAQAMRKHSPEWRAHPRFGRPGAPVRPYVEGDADGDGRSDTLNIQVGQHWGDLNYHDLYRANRKVGSRENSPLLGQPRASGDFDGDGRQDLVIERTHADTGAVRTVMRLSSGFPADEVEIPTPAASWRIFSAGDVDGDGRSDLLLGQGLQEGDQVLAPDGRVAPDYRNPRMTGFAYWVMDRGRVARYSLGFLTDPAAPRLAARGDFNGDGRLDLVWSSPTGSSARAARMWAGAGEGFSSSPITAAAPGWEIIAGGDVDADGKSDLVLQSNEAVAHWIMDGSRIAGFSPAFVIGRIDLASDFNGDGRLDFLRQQLSACRNPPVEMWLGDGAGLEARPVAPYGPREISPRCQIVGAYAVFPR